MALAGIAAVLVRPAYGVDPTLYEDKDNDLVADLPSDPRRVVNPKVIYFAYVPGEDSPRYELVWSKLKQHLEIVTGRKVEFRMVQKNTPPIEAMRSRRLHIGGLATGTVPLAVNCAGFVPFAVMGGTEGIVGYQMEIVTFPGSEIKSPFDLKGRTFTFTDKSSNSGYKLPWVILKNDFKLVGDKDYKITRDSGGHGNSLLGVARKHYEAAAVANDVLTRMLARGEIKREQIISIYKSDTYPTAAFGMAHNLHPKLATKVREAFYTFSWSGTELEKEYAVQGASRFVPISYKKDWARVREIDTAMNVSYDCKSAKQ